MKPSFSLLYLLLFVVATGQAQSPFLWKELVDKGYDEKILDIAVRKDDVILFCGMAYERADLYSYILYGTIDHANGKIESEKWGEGSSNIGMNIIPLRDNRSFMVGVADVGNPQHTNINEGIYAWIEKGKVIRDGAYGGEENDWLVCAQECSNGDVVAGGKYATGDKNMIMVRFAPDGSIKKEATYKFNEFESLKYFVEKENGNFIVVGNSGQINNTNRLIFETDSNLNVLWRKESDNAYLEEISSVCLADTGGYLVAGTSSYKDGRKEAWYALLNERGEVVWEKPIDNFPRENKNIRVKNYSPGKYALAFNYYGENERDDLSKNHDLRMLIINNNGATVWEYIHFTKELEYFSDMEVSKDGNLLLAGLTLGVDSLCNGYVYCFAPRLNSKNGNVLAYVFDKETNQPITGATLVVKNEDGRTDHYTTNTSGGVSVPLPSDMRFVFHIEAMGYEPLEDAVVLSPEGVKQENKYYLVRAKAGSHFIMKSVIFERGTTRLLPDAYPELDKLVQFMKDHPEVKIELSGHTDNGGLPKANQTLSEQRVATVKNYLVSKGITANRITGKGYGGKKPIAPNNTEENKSKNRRVEVKIL